VGQDGGFGAAGVLQRVGENGQVGEPQVLGGTAGGDCDIPNCIRPTPSYRTQSFNSLPVLTALLTFRARPGYGSLPG
jgi:hypothetical protein